VAAGLRVADAHNPCFPGSNKLLNETLIYQGFFIGDILNHHLLLIAPSRSYRVASYLQEADKLGYRVIIVSDSKHSLVSAIASGITVDFSKPEQALEIVLSALQEKKVAAIISTDDSVVMLSSKIARQLNLPHNQTQSSTLTYRKDLARQRLKQAGCNVPEFSCCHFNETEQVSNNLHYPVVLKPLMLSGSRGVIRANNPAEFSVAASTVQNIVSQEKCDDFESQHFLVEQYLEGEEIALDGFVQDGQLITLALFDKPEPLTGPYFEESYYITPSRYPAEIQQAITDEIQRCCIAYGLTHGPVHAEARLTDQGVVLIELASRTIGGQCSELINYVLGIKLEEIIIQLMCMQEINLPENRQYAGVLMIPIRQTGILKRVEGITRARQVEYIRDIEIHIQPGYELVPLPQGASYLGFIFASAPEYEQTYQALRSAYECLKFKTTQNWALEPT